MNKEDYSNKKERMSIGCENVKTRDLEDNLNVTRLQKIDSYAADRINRYLKALRFLKKADQINILTGIIPSTEIM